MAVLTKKTGVTIILILLLIFAGIRGGASVLYAKPNLKEYSVKAAFLFNFGKFIEWPSGTFPNSSSSLNLYILGNDPFGETLKTIEGKLVKERELVIKKCSRVEEIIGCHILFISSSEKKNLLEIFAKIENMPILTVGEIKGFCKSRGIINFKTKKKKVLLEINVDAAQRAGLKISSKLLRLSEIIKER